MCGREGVVNPGTGTRPQPTAVAPLDSHIYLFQGKSLTYYTSPSPRTYMTTILWHSTLTCTRLRNVVVQLCLPLSTVRHFDMVPLNRRHTRAICVQGTTIIMAALFGTMRVFQLAAANLETQKTKIRQRIEGAEDHCICLLDQMPCCQGNGRTRQDIPVTMFIWCTECPCECLPSSQAVFHFFQTEPTKRYLLAGEATK